MAETRTNDALKLRALNLHESFGGKIETKVKIPVNSLADLALAYSPGVAEPCRKIAANPADAFRYTSKRSTVAVVSDGSAVLGLGKIGALAALPVMEGKALLFKHFAGLDAVPICLNTQSTEQLIEICCALEPSYGGINLEDIASPHCVTIERTLQQCLRIPVFHDDQHGTAVVTAAALQNAARITGRRIEQMRIVISGMGAAGSAIARLLKRIGVTKIWGTDLHGSLSGRAPKNNCNNFVIQELFEEQVLSEPERNPEGLSQAENLAALLCGADAFIGVSAPGILTRKMVASMAPDPIVFAMANPDPEIMPEEALAGGAAVVGSGRMDYPNQINNLLAFPGIFRGAMLAQEERAPKGLPTRITEEMQLAAVAALAGILGTNELRVDYLLPSPMNPQVVQQVSAAVYHAAKQQ